MLPVIVFTCILVAGVAAILVTLKRVLGQGRVVEQGAANAAENCIPVSELASN
jgi:hypothetical protein